MQNHQLKQTDSDMANTKNDQKIIKFTNTEDPNKNWFDRRCSGRVRDPALYVSFDYTLNDTDIL